MKLQMVAIALVSAMAGGVFGVALWRAVDKPAVSDKPTEVGGWWCRPSGNCQRTQVDCERDERCHVRRIAFCPIATHTAAGSLFAFCYSTRASCERNVEEHREQMDLAAHCVGVE